MNVPNQEILDKENLESAGNVPLTNIKPSRMFGRELHNCRKNNYTPKSKRLKFKEQDNSETRERAVTSLQLSHPAIQTINEYYANINSFLIEKDSTNKINRDYMHAQTDINSKMRAILVDWLTDVHLKFELLPQTLFACINLLDRFLEKVSVQRSKLQLIGISCLMIVSKIEEIYSPMAKDYLEVCDNAYTTKQLLEMEGEILEAVNFNVLCPNSYNFLSNFNSKFEMEDKLFYYVQFLLETAMLDLTYLKHSNLVLTAGAIFFTNKLFKKEGWPEFYEKTMGVSEHQLKGAAKDLFVIMKKIEKADLTAINRKFGESQFLEVSKYMITKAQPKE